MLQLRSKLYLMLLFSYILWFSPFISLVPSLPGIPVNDNSSLMAQGQFNCCNAIFNSNDRNAIQMVYPSVYNVNLSYFPNSNYGGNFRIAHLQSPYKTTLKIYGGNASKTYTINGKANPNQNYNFYFNPSYVDITIENYKGDYKRTKRIFRSQFNFYKEF